MSFSFHVAISLSLSLSMLDTRAPFEWQLFAPPWTPESPYYRFQVVEEQPIGTILTTMQATDADSTIAEYRMTENGFFEINNTTGKQGRDHRHTIRNGIDANHIAQACRLMHATFHPGA